MNRIRTLLKFSLPARTAVKKFRYSSSSAPCDSNTTSLWKLLEPGFVTLSCTDRAAGDYTLSYTDGSASIFRTAFCPRHHRLTNSCGNLIGVHDTDMVWICNPRRSEVTSIDKWNELPTVPHAAIGLDRSINLYKVVQLHPPYEDHELKSKPIRCEVMTLIEQSRELRWESVDDHPPTGLVLMENHLPVAADGAVYWTLEPKYSRSKFRRPAVALSFDVAKEEFGIVFHPEGYSMDGAPRLVDLGGRPCLADTRSGRMTIWALADRWKSEWVKRCEIDLSGLNASPKYFPSYKLVPLAMDDETIVFYYGQGGRREYYDIPTMSFFEHEIVGNVDLEFVAPYPGRGRLLCDDDIVANLRKKVF